MLDFSRRARLASSDLGRRAAFLGVAALIALVGAGFLLATFWTVLAHELGWGAVWASLVIAVFCLIAAGLLALAARKPRHVMPDAGDLTREIKARSVLASEAAIAGMHKKADLARRTIVQNLFGFRDRLHHDVDVMAGRLDATASRMAQTAHRAPQRDAQPGARPPEHRDDAAAGAGPSGLGKDPSGGWLGHAAPRLRLSPGLALVSAFAVGLALAGAIGGSDDDDDTYDDHEA